MKKTLRVLSSAALAGSILFTQAAPAFAKQVNFYPSELKLVETVSTVNVTYDKNCSDSVKVPDSQSAETETAVTISFETPVRDGYTFAGWSENKNANENDQLLHGGDAFTVKGNTRLYAIWVKDQAPAAEETKPAPETNEEPEVQETTVTVQEETQEESANEAVTYQLMLDTHGGSLGIDHVDSDEQGTVTVPAEAPVKDGNTFLGWAEDPESGIVKHQPGETFTIENDLKLYAVWQENQPTVTYQLMLDTHGGSMSIDHVDSDEQGTVTVPTEVPVKDGNTFLGWAEDPESGIVKHQPGETFTIESDMKLYAVWQENKPVVTYQLMLDTHGGSMSIDHVDSDAQGNVTVPAEKPVKNGFIFLGWAEDPESGIVKHQPGETFTINNDMKLYAVWQAEHPVVQATLAFDANGGTGGPTSIKANVDGTVTIPTLIPVRNGYKFLGWSADAKATKATYSPGQTIKINADFKLYAVWQDNKSVNTGVHNNTMFYAFTALAAAAFAGSVFMMKKKDE